MDRGRQVRRLYKRANKPRVCFNSLPFTLRLLRLTHLVSQGVLVPNPEADLWKSIQRDQRGGTHIWHFYAPSFRHASWIPPGGYGIPHVKGLTLL